MKGLGFFCYYIDIYLFEKKLFYTCKFPLETPLIQLDTDIHLICTNITESANYSYVQNYRPLNVRDIYQYFTGVCEI